RGHRFATASDTEVIVHLYEEHGMGCLAELNGQFAFALWDSRTGRLFLARDRLGIRPLHYTVQGKRLLFASEVKALFTDPTVRRELDPVALDQTCTAWSPQLGRTAFADIVELPPGHFLEAGPDSVSSHRYWAAPFVPREGRLDWPPERIAGRVRELLTDAVRLRLQADVPVGAYVSGGLDSSAVAALVATRFNPDVRTFGIRFEDKRFDEGEEQQRMVSWLRTPHGQVYIGEEDIAAALRNTLWHTEKPLLRTSPVPLYLLSRLVRDSGLKVVLTGEGADEVFGGYNLFKEALVRRFWARDPSSPLRRRLAEELYPNIFTSPRMRHLLPVIMGQYLDNADDPLFSHRLRWATTRRISALYSRELQASLPGHDVAEEIARTLPSGFARWDALSRAQYVEMTSFLSTYLLSSQGDRVAMAHSVEIRLPYLDHRLVELACRIPPHWRMLGLQEKHILRRAVADLLPPTVAQRRKFPYRAPIARALMAALRQHDMAGCLERAALLEAGVFDPDRVEALLRRTAQRGDAGEVDGMALAAVLSTMVVYDLFVKRFQPLSILPRRRFDVFVDRRTAAVPEGPNVVAGKSRM
ncbi:MAG: asparagine synthase (glutamine-hydrolyzing), partial [Chitinivibrionales bacterium]|nr:asparagine synthase (glutamine-hydrolyzing) [Chitinivibrionales bacterium]